MIDTLLNEFSRDALTARRFSGMDAATYFVPDGEDEPPDDILEIMDESPSKRIYPTDGGNIWMVPFVAVRDHASHFERQAKAWDHVHCDFCEDTISIGDTFYTCDHPDHGCCVFCRECGNKTKTI